MTNLLNELSETLQTKLADFGVSYVAIVYGEVNLNSNYDVDNSFIEAIETELTAKGYSIEYQISNP